MKIRSLIISVGLLLAGVGAGAQGILPANNGTLDLGQTLAGVPVVAWYKVQEPLVSLTATTNNAVFGVALVADTGNGHGTLPAASFAESVTANCNNCWLGIQFYSQTVGTATATLVLTPSSGSAETVALQGEALSTTGVVVTPGMENFGAVAVHSSSAPVTFVVTNLVTDSSAVTVQSVGVSGDYVLAPGGDCTGSVEPAAACVVRVSFSPTATGERAGTLTVVTTGGTVTAALTGTGTADPGVGLNPVALNFEPGTAATQTVVVTNTGTASVSVGAVSVSGGGFGVSSGCAALAVGASCSVVVTFTPQGVVETGAVSIPVTVNGVTTLYSVVLTGAYTLQDAGLGIVPGTVDFGAAGTGTDGGSRVLTVSNLTNEALGLAFAMPREFALRSVAPCPTLAARGSCSFAVGWLPVTGGPLTGTVTVTGTPADGSAAVQGLGYLLGYGTPGGTLAITGFAIPNTPLTFGEVTSGQSAALALTLTNKGTTPMTVRRITSAPPFLSTTTCGGVMAAKASCSVTVTYAPVFQVATTVGVAARTDVGTMTIESDAVSSPDMVAMTGVALPVVGAVSSSGGAGAFALSEGALTFGNTQVGDVSSAQVVTLTNTGTVAAHVSSEIVSTDFAVSSACGTVAVGATCDLSVTFTPTTASSAAERTGTVELLSDAATALEFVSLLGTSTPAALALTPVTLDFGTVNVGAKEALSVTVANTGTVAVTVAGVSASGDYTVDATGCPEVGATLAVGATCTLTVTFRPAAIGARSGTLSVASDASQLPLTVSLNGVGTEGVLTVTPGALVFGDIDVGYSSTMTVNLLNTGNASVTGIVNAVAGTNPLDFVVTIPCPVTTLAPNQGCAETVRFEPSAVGARTATLSVESSDVNGPAVVALGGTGVAGGSFVLTVNGPASETVASGSPGSFPLLVTPTNGFTGNVALTCAPVTAGADMSCSLLASTLTLGAEAMSSTATINTITSAGGVGVGVVAGLVLLPFARRRRGWMVGLGLVAMVGCGGGGGVTTNVRTAPAGTYQYVVTASSTGGDAVMSSVTLTLVVR